MGSGGDYLVLNARSSTKWSYVSVSITKWQLEIPCGIQLWGHISPTGRSLGQLNGPVLYASFLCSGGRAVSEYLGYVVVRSGGTGGNLPCHWKLRLQTYTCTFPQMTWAKASSWPGPVSMIHGSKFIDGYLGIWMHYLLHNNFIYYTIWPREIYLKPKVQFPFFFS